MRAILTALLLLPTTLAAQNIPNGPDTYLVNNLGAQGLQGYGGNQVVGKCNVTAGHSTGTCYPVSSAVWYDAACGYGTAGACIGPVLKVHTAYNGTDAVCDFWVVEVITPWTAWISGGNFVDTITPAAAADTYNQDRTITCGAGSGSDIHNITKYTVSFTFKP